MITEEDFLRTKMSKWDYVCMYIWILPIRTFFGMGAVAILTDSLDTSNPLVKVLLIIFLIGFALTITLKTLLANKVTVWKNEYQHLLNGDN